MKPAYFVLDSTGLSQIPATIRPAEPADYFKTVQEHWQTDWMSDFIQQEELEKYTLELTESRELVGLGAYRDMPDGMLVYIEYIESAPGSNPALSVNRKYRGIGAALLAYGIQLSIDYGYGGAIYLKAKTSAIREHYIQDFGAIPFSRIDPYLLLIDGDAAKSLFTQFLREED